jgi:hypothetical protein
LLDYEATREVLRRAETEKFHLPANNDSGLVIDSDYRGTGLQLKGGYVWTYSETCLISPSGFSVPPGLAPAGAAALGQTYSSSGADTGIEHSNGDGTGFVKGQGILVYLGSPPLPANRWFRSPNVLDLETYQGRRPPPVWHAEKARSAYPATCPVTF